MELTPEQIEAARELLEAELLEKVTKENDDLLEEKAAERLADMKSKMDKMDAKLKAAEAEKSKEQEARKEAERKRLQDEGKHLELREMEMKELSEKNARIEEELSSMKRSRVVDDLVSDWEFVSNKARASATAEIARELQQDDDGNWQHRSGASVDDFIKAYKKDPDNDYYFKPKTNSGTGQQKAKTSGMEGKKKLTEMTSAELLEAANAGALGELSF